MGNLNPYTNHGLPISGTTAQLPANPMTGDMYWDGNKFYVYDDVTGWNAIKPDANGVQPTGQTGIGYTARLRLLDGRNSDGSALISGVGVSSSSGGTAAGNFIPSITAGNELSLLGESAKNNTKIDNVIYETTLPQGYAPGTPISVIVNADYIANAGTTPTCTVLAALYRLSDSGPMGANLVTTGALAITTVAADKTFAVTGTTLLPGDRVLVKVTASVQEAGNTGSLNGQVNGVRLV